LAIDCCREVLHEFAVLAAQQLQRQRGENTRTEDVSYRLAVFVDVGDREQPQLVGTTPEAPVRFWKTLYQRTMPE
jgi:hypothetical protein